MSGASLPKWRSCNSSYLHCSSPYERGLCFSTRGVSCGVDGPLCRMEGRFWAGPAAWESGAERPAPNWVGGQGALALSWGGGGGERLEASMGGQGRPPTLIALWHHCECQWWLLQRAKWWWKFTWWASSRSNLCAVLSGEGGGSQSSLCWRSHELTTWYDFTVHSTVKAGAQVWCRMALCVANQELPSSNLTYAINSLGDLRQCSLSQLHLCNKGIIIPTVQGYCKGINKIMKVKRVEYWVLCLYWILDCRIRDRSQCFFLQSTMQTVGCI